MENNFLKSCFSYRAFFFMFIYDFEYLNNFLLNFFLLCKLKFEILAPGAEQKKMSPPALAPEPKIQTFNIQDLVYLQ